MVDTRREIATIRNDSWMVQADAPGFKPSKVEKAAIILASLGPERSAPFLKEMTEPTLRRFATAITRLKRIPSTLLHQVSEEFIEELGDAHGIQGGSSKARRMLDQVLDSTTVARIMSDVDGNTRRSIWDQLGAASNVAVAQFLQAEHPQTAAVVLSELRADKAAAVLEVLEPEFAQITVLRLSRVPRLEPDVVSLIEDVIVRDFLSAVEAQMATRRPADLIAGLMNNVSTQLRERMLGHLDSKKPELASEVQRVMFTFADIVTRVAAKDVSLIARNVEEDVLLTALKSGLALDIESATFILENIARRLSERYIEDIEAMADVRVKDGEIAQALVISEIQRLQKKGDLRLLEPDAP